MVLVTLLVMKVPDQKESEPLSKEKGKVGSSFVELLGGKEVAL
jgi:hypothetical protein